MRSSLKFCMIASSEFDFYAARARAREWDYAAGHAIAEGAGAIVRTHQNKKILYGKRGFKNPSLLIKGIQEYNGQDYINHNRKCINFWHHCF